MSLSQLSTTELMQNHSVWHNTERTQINTNETNISTNTTAVALNTTHRTSNGSDHTFIDQDVTSGATPTFGNDNFTEATDKNYVTDAQLVVIDNTSGTNTGDEVSATSSTEGIVELATTAEIDTGTDSTRAMPIDQFVASNRNIRYIDWRVLDSATDQIVDTSIGGDFEFPFTGTITSIGAYFDTAGTTGTATIDVNLNGSTIMTTNKISVETGEKSSRDATTQPTLTTTAITAGDILTVDQDAIQTGTAGKGLVVRLGVKQS